MGRCSALEDRRAVALNGRLFAFLQRALRRLRAWPCDWRCSAGDNGGAPSDGMVAVAAPTPDRVPSTLRLDDGPPCPQCARGQLLPPSDAPPHVPPPDPPQARSYWAQKRPGWTRDGRSLS